MTKFLESPRELTPKEVAMYEKAQQKWLPTIIQSFQTPIHEMMASPVKRVFLQFMIVLPIVVAFILLFVTNRPPPYLIAFIIISPIMSASLMYFSVVRKNQNLMMVASLLPKDQIPTKYDYESSPVVQAKLMRKSMGRMGSGGLAGGLVGGVVGGSMGRRR